jgi:hypothetical protein
VRTLPPRIIVHHPLFTDHCQLSTNCTLSLTGRTRNHRLALRQLDLFGLAAVRIARLLIKQKELKGLGIDPDTRGEFEEIARQLGLDEE